MSRDDLKIVVFMGRDKVGKSTFSTYLKDHLGDTAMELPSAFVIIEEMTLLYGIPNEYFIDQDKKSTFIRLGDFKYLFEAFMLFAERNFTYDLNDFEDISISPRDLMIVHSLHIRRKTDPDYFVNRYEEKLNLLPSSIKVVINDGARMPNELDAIFERRGYFFFLHKGGDKFAGPFRNELEEAAIGYVKHNAHMFTNIKVPEPISKDVFDANLRKIMQTRSERI